MTLEAWFGRWGRSGPERRTRSGRTASCFSIGRSSSRTTYTCRVKRKVYLETFGCQMNVLDSELVLSQLRARGYEEEADREVADVILYNTCSVREHAEQKVWSRLGELKGRKEADPSLVIGVIGCMAERDGLRIFERFPQVDILCGPGSWTRLAGMVHNAG